MNTNASGRFINIAIVGIVLAMCLIVVGGVAFFAFHLDGIFMALSLAAVGNMLLLVIPSVILAGTVESRRWKRA